MSTHWACIGLVLAWVAWLHSTYPSKGIDEWTVLGAEESAEQCKLATVTAARNSARKLQSDKAGTVVTQDGPVVEMAFASGERASLVYMCLPDSVDPRGPKGMK